MGFNTFDGASDPRLLANLDANFSLFGDTSDSTKNAGLIAHDPLLTYAAGTVGDDLNQALEAIKTLQGDAATIIVTVDISGTVLTISVNPNLSLTNLTLSNSLVVGNNSSVAQNLTVGNSLSVANNAILQTVDAQTLLKGVGDASGGSAAAGYIGEYIEAFSASTFNLANATLTSLATITLTPGDWLVGGSVQYQGNGSVKVSTMAAGISDNSAGLPTVHYCAGWLGSAANLMPTGLYLGGAVPSRVFTVAANTPVYITTIISSTVSTCYSVGHIWARRMR